MIVLTNEFSLREYKTRLRQDLQDILLMAEDCEGFDATDVEAAARHYVRTLYRWCDEDDRDAPEPAEEPNKVYFDAWCLQYAKEFNIRNPDDCHESFTCAVDWDGLGLSKSTLINLAKASAHVDAGRMKALSEAFQKETQETA